MEKIITSTDDFTANTTDELAGFILDELGRWIALDCPALFKSRKLETNLFEFLHENLEKTHAPPLSMNFTSNGYVVIKITPSKSNSWAISVARFQMADPKLKENLAACLQRLNNADESDFISASKARKQWIRHLA